MRKRHFEFHLTYFSDSNQGHWFVVQTDAEGTYDLASEGLSPSLRLPSVAADALADWLSELTAEG